MSVPNPASTDERTGPCTTSFVDGSDKCGQVGRRVTSMCVHEHLARGLFICTKHRAEHAQTPVVCGRCWDAATELVPVHYLDE